MLQEDDERFFVGIGLTRSEKRIVIESASKTTSEVHWVDSNNPTNQPRVVLSRQAGVEYDVEHDGQAWLIRTNRPGADGRPATNFALYRLPERSTDPSDLEEVMAARVDVKLESVEAFAGHLVISERSEVDGLERLRVLDRVGGSDLVIEQPEAAYSLLGDPNPGVGHPHLPIRLHLTSNPSQLDRIRPGIAATDDSLDPGGAGRIRRRAVPHRTAVGEGR